MLVVLLALSLGGARSSTGGDAGSGADAGDSMPNALPLPGYGYYAGSLASTQDRDWYKTKPPSWYQTPLCVSFEVSGSVLANARIVSVAGNDNRTVGSLVRPLSTTRLALAFPAWTATYVALTPPTDSPGVAGGYSFNVKPLRLSDIVNGDNGSGSDAGSTRATALPVQAGCIGGTLRPSNGDSVDRYAYTASAGDRLVVSLTDAAAAGLWLYAEAPDGTVYPRSGPDEILSIPITQGGVWNIVLTATSNNSNSPLPYVVAVFDEEPEPRPCQPSCR